VILIDSSAWVEFLRATGSPLHLSVRDALAGDGDVACTEVVAMEVLAGATDDADRGRLRRLLYRFAFLPVAGLWDYEHAAELYTLCRRRGKTVRKLTDCLIATVAIRNDAQLLCDDSDFLAIASCAPLSLAAWRR
jgi:predicted nucleic acid-binding protein